MNFNSMSSLKLAEGGQAKFIGWQQTKSGHMALYNIVWPKHPQDGSTVTAKTLQQLGIPIPPTPPQPAPGTPSQPAEGRPQFANWRDVLSRR